LSLVVTGHADTAAFARLRPEWAALAALTSPRTPFTTPEWNELWWRHMRRASGGLRDELRLYELRDAAGRLVGMAPMMLTSIPGRGPARLRELQFLGADPNMTEIRGPVCAPADHAAVVAALQAFLHSRAADWDWIRWAGLRGGPGLLAASPGRGFVDQREVPDLLLQLGSSWDEFRAALPRNIKESLRKCYNAPERAGLKLGLGVATGVAETPAAIERFIELHNSRAQSDARVAHADVFSSTAARAFLHDFALAMAREGTLRVFQLTIDGQIVASRVGFLYERELYLYYSGYDTAWGKYSVMTTVVAEALKWAIQNRVPLANLSTGRDVSKTRWRPRELLHSEVVELGSGAKARLGYRLLQMLRGRGKAGHGPVTVAPPAADGGA
jgi:CelD/BcsL family acetyltransferase involved in cellulose biosynthesis